MATVDERRRAFRALHERGCFVMPNPWDVGSARHLEHLGFRALATTSAGFAFSRGLPDGAVPRDAMLEHIRDVTQSTALPVNADFEGGYARAPEDVAANVLRCVATGVAGLSIEDATGDPAEPLHPFDLAVARVRAARRAIDEAGGGVVLTGRSEGFLVGRPDLEETIRRLAAYAEAGADCLYAPRVVSREQIAALVRAVAPRPLNVLVSSDAGLSVADLAALGVRRISVGSTLARAAWTGFMRAAAEIAGRGTFRSFGDLRSFEEVNGLFGGPR
jgi:2-methylisocitrate lyase-like PEP mutase family enzyme